ncbi:hypothetical protein CMK11_07315 [Candidatus Poribacteria bacterium]|nr:hypothetical protein [Candidatus Poribacteria bacterium]
MELDTLMNPVADVPLRVLRGGAIADGPIHALIRTCCEGAVEPDADVVLESTPDIVVVASRDDGEPIALYALSIGTGVLEFIGVDPAWRRLGAGTALEAHLVTAGRQRGWESIRTRSMLNERNVAGVGFLDDRGWTALPGGIRMSRGLHDLPPIRVPDGFAIRTYRPGDAEGCIRILNAAFPHGPEWTGDEFEREYLAAPHFTPGSLFLAVRDGVLVGTATAACGHHDGRDRARLHWVAVMPGYARRGLGRALSLRALHHMRTLGYEEATLGTMEWLPGAAELYRSLGFRDLYRHAMPYHKRLL